MDYKIFKNKKILIFCPHEDDEINIVGGLLLELKKIKCSKRVVFSTNGDYYINGKIRLEEAISSLKILGVDKNHITFLGYPDQDECNDNHIYMSNEQFISKKGNKYTNVPFGEEYHYKKHKKHGLLNKNTFIQDIEDLINEEKADYIICVDYDSHCDHRALSLSFECALGRILKKSEYRPIILKAFAYPTTYKGVNDFKSKKISISKFNVEPKALYKLQNPYYNWENRISINTYNVTGNRILLFNKLFKAIKTHKSQFLPNEAYSIINADQVFFLRRTDNLLYKSKITTTSGDSKYLNDFMLFDSSNIMRGYDKFPIIDKGYTKLDDDKKEINIKFKHKVNIEEINIYEYVNCNNELNKITLLVNGKRKIYSVEKENYTYHLNNLGIKQINKLTIILNTLEEIDLTEIECFSTNTKIDKVKEETTNNKINIIDKLIFKINDITIFICNKINRLINNYRKRNS